MASLRNPLGRGRSQTPSATPAKPLMDWARPLFASPLTPRLQAPGGEVLVWAVADDASTATITEQFKAGAEEYHRRYAASDHFEHLFRQALDFTGIAVAEGPTILDLGSGSGVNSVVPCGRLFPGARTVATDLSAELLAMLAGYLSEAGSSQDVACVMMDAMGEHVAPGAFDLVTGASILHHLVSPERGIKAAARALKPGGHAVFFEPFNGWSVIRLAFERILAEADLRREALDPPVDAALRGLVADLAGRSRHDRTPEEIAAVDDKWLFSRTRMENAGRAAGFATVRFVPHNDHASMYRDVTMVHLRLATGRTDLQLPAWAMGVLDGFDAALSLHAKRELMLEGTIVMTKGD
jgi:SAM-dependent methyltransferase